MQNQNHKSNKAIKQTDASDWIQLPHQRLARQLKKQNGKKLNNHKKIHILAKKQKHLAKHKNIPY